jgi:hypothetical protein
LAAAQFWRFPYQLCGGQFTVGEIPQRSSDDRWASANAGTGLGDFSEIVGSALVAMNARVNEPTLHGALMEISFGSYHDTGMNVQIGDGSTRFISSDINFSVYQAIFSRSGGEVANVR